MSQGHYLIPAEEFCRRHSDASKPCSRPDVFAFQVGSGVALIYCAIIGVYSWYITKRAHANIPQTPEGRLYTYLAESEKLAAISFTFQTWDFFISLRIPEHSTAVMLTHHVLAATVSWFAVHNQVCRFHAYFTYAPTAVQDFFRSTTPGLTWLHLSLTSQIAQFLHYYGIYFLGLVEVSSIFLLFIDLAKYFPPEPNSVPEMVLLTFIGPAFIVTFFIYRVLLWWKVSLQLWADALHVLQTGKNQRYRPGQNYVLYIYLISNTLLGVLQLYWFGIILEEAKKAFFRS